MDNGHVCMCCLLHILLHTLRGKWKRQPKYETKSRYRHGVRMNKSNCVSVSCSRVRLKIEGITRRSCMRQELGTDLLLLKMI
jgi:hypothetical protein